MNSPRARNGIIVLLIAGGFLVNFFWPLISGSGNDMGFCPFRYITGIPCPGCGMGRATNLLFHGNLIDSLAMHPLAIAFLIACGVAVVWIVADIITGRDTFYPKLTRPWPQTFRLLLMAIVTASYAYTLLFSCV